MNNLFCSIKSILYFVIFQIRANVNFVLKKVFGFPMPLGNKHLDHKIIYIQ